MSVVVPAVGKAISLSSTAAAAAPRLLRDPLPRIEPRALSVASSEFTYTVARVSTSASRSARGRTAGRTFAEDKVEGEVDELARRRGERDDRADRAEAACAAYTLSVAAWYRYRYARRGSVRAPRQEPGVDAICHEHSDRRVGAAMPSIDSEYTYAPAHIHGGFARRDVPPDARLKLAEKDALGDGHDQVHSRFDGEPCVQAPLSYIHIDRLISKEPW